MAPAAGSETCPPPVGAPRGAARLRLGYACMNLTLGLTTSHTTRLATLAAPGGAAKLRGLVERNLCELQAILAWNAAAGYDLFRLGSSLVPFASHADFPYDWAAEHAPRLREVGRFAQKLGLRLSMHPGQYCNPGSPDDRVVADSLRELAYAARVMDLLGARDGVVVIHLGGVYGDRDASVGRFVDVLSREKRILRYLAVENDERCHHAGQVYDAATRLGVPMIFDLLHHRLNPGGLSEPDAVALAFDAWPAERGRPKFHLSTQAAGGKPGTHADCIDAADLSRMVELFAGREADLMLEAKWKDRCLPLEAVQQLRHGAPIAPKVSRGACPARGAE